MSQQSTGTVERIRSTEEGTYLHGLYYRIVQFDRGEGFDNFIAFYEWSMSHGFKPGKKLQKLVEQDPYSPGNCQWRELTPQELLSHEKCRAADWNRAVNRIRVHYGMEPFPEEV